MAELTLNGPVIRGGVHNVVLKDAVLHSPRDLPRDFYDYSIIKIGVREGDYTTWIGTWNQSEQKVDAAAPVSVLDTSRKGMRLKEKQAVVVEVYSEGSPEKLDGARINFRMAQVGGHYDGAGPLVSGASRVEDIEVRSAVQAIERQVNGRLSEWEEPVQLVNVVPPVMGGTFQGRLQRDSDTAISLQRYKGSRIEIDGESVGISSLGFSLTNTDALLASSGAIGTTAPSADTFYGVYAAGPLSPGGGGQLRLCDTAPTLYNGIKYLGTDILERRWRFCGWVYLNSSKYFSDSDVERHVVNYYNRLRKRLYLCPDYTDDGSATAMTAISSATWAQVNGGVGASVSFLSNGEDVVCLSAHLRGEQSGAIQFGIAVGIDGALSPETCATVLTAGATDRVYLSTDRYYEAGSAGQHTGEFLGVVSSGTVTVYADDVRFGGAFDPAVSYLIGHLMA